MDSYDDNGEIASKIFTVQALYWLKEHSIVFQDFDVNFDNLS
jgi:hypothetical protein